MQAESRAHLRSLYVRCVAPEPLSVRTLNVIQRLAADSGMTQQQLAAKSGLTQARISRLFNERAPLRVDDLEPLCRALNVSPLDVVKEAFYP